MIAAREWPGRRTCLRFSITPVLFSWSQRTNLDQLLTIDAGPRLVQRATVRSYNREDLRNPYPDFFNLDCDRYGPASRGPLPHKATARRFRSRAGQLRPRAGDKATQLRRHAFGGQFFACLGGFRAVELHASKH